jgi:hypothetical protein
VATVAPIGGQGLCRPTSGGGTPCREEVQPPKINLCLSMRFKIEFFCNSIRGMGGCGAHSRLLYRMNEDAMRFVGCAVVSVCIEFRCQMYSFLAA